MKKGKLRSEKCFVHSFLSGLYIKNQSSDLTRNQMLKLESLNRIRSHRKIPVATYPNEMRLFLIRWNMFLYSQLEGDCNHADYIYIVIFSTPNFVFASCPFAPTPTSILSTCLDTFGFWIGAYQMSSWMRKLTCREWIYYTLLHLHGCISRHSIICINIGNTAITLIDFILFNLSAVFQSYIASYACSQ